MIEIYVLGWRFLSLLLATLVVGGQLWLISEQCRNLPEGLAQKVVNTFSVLRQCNLRTLIFSGIFSASLVYYLIRKGCVERKGSRYGSHFGLCFSAY